MREWGLEGIKANRGAGQWVELSCSVRVIGWNEGWVRSELRWGQARWETR